MSFTYKRHALLDQRGEFLPYRFAITDVGRVVQRQPAAFSGQIHRSIQPVRLVSEDFLQQIGVFVRDGEMNKVARRFVVTVEKGRLKTFEQFRMFVQNGSIDLFEVEIRVQDRIRLEETVQRRMEILFVHLHRFVEQLVQIRLILDQ